MEEWWRRSWCRYVFLAVVIGHLYLPPANCVDYFDGPVKGDIEGSYSEPQSNANLGFDDVVRRHDGYVKGETPTIPKTSFSCSAQPYNPGLYADTETNCQVYHVCFEDRQESFLCGPGTNFNQRILACDFWYNFDCNDSPSFYGANADIGKVPETVYRPEQSIRGTQQTERPPSFPSYPAQRPVTGGDYQPPRDSRPSSPPPRPRPQPPRIQPPSPPRQEPIPPRPQSQLPRIPQPAQPPRVRQPSPHPPPTVQEEIDPGYDIPPQRPINVPPPPPPRQPHRPSPLTTQRPVFPPVVSPPRVTRPPIQHPVVIRRPDESSHPRVPTRPVQVPSRPLQPDTEVKGSDYRPPQPQPPRIPQPSQPADVGFPSYPSRPSIHQPVTGGRRPQQPAIIQQEHVDVDHIPPPPPPPQPARPSYRPSPPPSPPPQRPPVQQEVIVHPPPPPRPRPAQPPVAPSVLVPQQRQPSPPPSRPQIRVTSRPQQPPQRPRPVFPPVSDHPNANIKGGPGYRPPPPVQQPSYEPTRISHRPSGSTTQTGYQRPQPPPLPQRPPPPPPPRSRPQPPRDGGYQPPITVKQPSPSVPSPGYKRPSQPSSQTVDPGYKPSRTPSVSVSVARRPQPVPAHPDSGIKGADFGRPSIPRQPPRVIAPATSVSTVKRPQPSGGYPRPAIVKPQTPPAQTIGIKTTRPSTENQVYEQPKPVAPGRVKLPSQTQTSRIPQRPFPAPQPQVVDHPGSNIKGRPSYQQPRPQHPVRPVQPSRPVIVLPPSAPSTSIHRKTPPAHVQSTGRGQPQKPFHPRGDGGYQQQQEIVHDLYEPESRPPPPIAASKKDPVSTGVKRPSSSHQTIHVKPAQNEYDGGSNYKRGPEYYPKPEFQQQVRPVAVPSRSSVKTKQSSASQSRVSHQPSPISASHGSSGRHPQGSSQVDYPYRQVPGHQPPHQRQVFPHRDNPDHPNASIKGTNAYRPPPPANFQAAASEVQEQRVENPEQTAESEPEPKPEPSSKLGDTGSE